MKRIVTFASGKGGVGKTALAVATGQALVSAGHRVLLVDADLGLANVDVQLGLNHGGHFGLALTGRGTIADALLCEERTGLQILLGPSGWQSMTQLDAQALERLGSEIRALADSYDTTILDCSSGIAASTLELVRLAEDVLVVITDEPTSLTDAYALIKVGLRLKSRVGVVVNMAQDRDSGLLTFAKLQRTAKRFLDLDLQLAGIVRRDQRVPDAITSQQPLLTRSPNCHAADDIRELARAIGGTQPAEPKNSAA